MTDIFKVTNGVRQGDTISPTLFNLYTNDLVDELNALKCGVDIDGRCVSILLYADDVVIMSDSEDKLQKMINCVYSWCRRWRLCVNLAKTNVVHFRVSRNFIMEQMLLIMYVNINISELFFTNIWILLNEQIISQMLQAEHLELLYVSSVN